MKKFYMFLMGMLMILGLSFSSCTGCKTSPAVAEEDTIEFAQQDGAINVEHAIAMDREAMYLKFGDDYRWYETDMRLPNFLDEEDVTSEPIMLVNIFQGIVERGSSYDTWVWKFQHFPDGTVLTDSIQGFWIENMPLNEAEFKLTYKEAFDRMMEANAPKPHSRNAVLRNPIGPVAVNAQWIFGNISEQLWVDVVTGDVQTSNPAFPKDKGFTMPLGEWP